jgi:outer membrane protein TolC
MNVAVLLALQVAAGDSLPVVTLAEALQRSARLDPNYVAALGRVETADWGRRAALLTFFVPAITVRGDWTWSSQPLFGGLNQAGQLVTTSQLVTTQADARIDLFTGGQKVFGYRQADALLDAARAGELAARFAAALQTESDYYAVIAEEELTRTARERVARAQEQFDVARARVRTGAAVQTDSLQLSLELTRASVSLLREESALRVARLQLGRRVGVEGPVGAAPLDTAPAPPLPFPLADAVRRALAQGPEYRQARAVERGAQAAFNVRRGAYLPRVSLAAQVFVLDSAFYPRLLSRNQLFLTVSLPIWDNGNREIALTQARTARDVAQAIRADFERAAQRDVGAAYDAYETARAAAALATDAVVVARENFRIQQTRYRSGATTILDLLDSQVNLSDAEAGLVEARYVTRLALAALEAILGERLFNRNLE